MTARELFDSVVLPSARENAFETEGLRALATSRGVRIDETPEFVRTVYASAEMVIDSMASYREFREYVSKPIPVRTHRALLKILAQEVR